MAPFHAYFLFCEYYPHSSALSSRTKPFKAHILSEAVSPQHIHGDFLNHLSTNTTHNLKVWPLESFWNPLTLPFLHWVTLASVKTSLKFTCPFCKMGSWQCPFHKVMVTTYSGNRCEVPVAASGRESASLSVSCSTWMEFGPHYISHYMLNRC